MEPHNISPRIIRRLPESSSVKEDLQTVYELIQEIGYTQYNVLRLTETLAAQVDVVRSLSTKHGFLLDKHHENSETGLEDHQYLREQLLLLSTSIENTLSDLQESINGDDCNGREQLIQNAAILVKASRQILLQAGYDPETGVQKSEIDRDWSRFKRRLLEVGLGGLAALVIGWAVQAYINIQQQQTSQTHQQVQELLESMKKYVDKVERESNKKGR